MIDGYALAGNCLQLIFIVVLGLILGSFTTVLVHRVPEGRSWFAISGRNARSACSVCKQTLSIRDLVPIFSWVFARGRCRYCHERIDAKYPLIEILALISTLLAFILNGPVFETIIIISFVPFLLAMFFIDLESFILPDQLMAICGGLALVLVLWQAWLFQEPALLLSGLFAACLYAFFSWALGTAMSRILRKDALGFGDVKFFAVSGLALGLAQLPIFLSLSGILGIVFGLFWIYVRKENVFPFGPALITAFYILLISV